MKIPVSALLAISTLFSSSTLAATPKPSRRDALKSWDSVQARHLSPAYPHGGLQKRQSGRILRNEANLDFVDHTAHVTADSNQPVLYTTLNVRSNHPVLSLEDLEIGLTDVTCSDGMIKLTFSSPHYMEQVAKELASTEDFVAISSHWGCNQEEERAPHIINGDVVLSTGSFSMNRSDDSGLTSALAFVSEGLVDMELSKMFARMELELALEAGKELLNFTVPMPSVPLTPFMVPEDSGFTLNFGSPANSTIKGLKKYHRPRANQYSVSQHTTFTEIPFQSSQGITDLTFSISFSPEILFGIRSPTGIISGGAGVTFNMPQASVKISQLDNVDEACEMIPHVPGQGGDMSKNGSLIDSLIGNFTHVEPSLEFNVVPFIELQLDLPRGEFLQQLEATVTSTELSLPTACLAFDKEMNTYGAPAQVLATPTAKPTTTASEAKKAAAVRVSVAGKWAVLCMSVLAAVVFTAL
ncbi:hypothetical protein MGYG_07104 [Nannizzia gypsea CBS 118893]|uniref:DUF7029 domain-containing protein n=1 Tax=Arthroderma gypseum (strain ATCC MYA-4604 / CBS 118893) TaxID=535722 RepID=E4V232_ARTGP|nr:hypothetical protein MGYG_07104 [Nannizzia gypsea CBS 118893]EFR04097.1 hypothetical protein MGYG_07104 [Nannizzia gypsea CBS 118893]